jgi:menaquinone-9 beta-reductase
VQNYEIVIVGAGPAGASTALRLATLDPKLADKILLLDKASFPRPKLCAGGITGSAENMLAQLGVSTSVPSKAIHTSRFMFPTGTLTLKKEGHIRIVRRQEFDYDLLLASQKRGIVTRDGEAVERVVISSDRVVVRTSKNEYCARIIIGADGANSVVRRFLGLSRASRVMIACEVLAPLDRLLLPALTENMAFFDFNVITRGINGYCWIFPSAYERSAMVSLGIIETALNRNGGVPLQPVFARWLAGVVPEQHRSEMRAHPIIRYEPRIPCSAYRALLVGDAAGIDPLFGEGITCALALGMLAAEISHEALGTRNFAFTDYERRIHSSPIGKMIRRRRIVARRLYRGAAEIDRSESQITSILDWVTPLNPSATSSRIAWEGSSQ